MWISFLRNFERLAISNPVRFPSYLTYDRTREPKTTRNMYDSSAIILELSTTRPFHPRCMNELGSIFRKFDSSSKYFVSIRFQ